MTKLLFTFCLVSITQFVFSQKKSHILWHLTVVDSSTAKGIERATISFINGTDFVTDINGDVDINLVNLTDSVIISSIGYKSRSFIPSGKYRDTISLSASPITLSEVRVKSNLKKLVLGSTDESYDGGYLLSPNEEIAEYIPNNAKVHGTIVSVEFALNNGKKGIEMPFKVNLYLKSDDSMYPDHELIKDSIIIYNLKRLTVVSVDISKYGISVPEKGFFVGFEALSPSWYSKNPIKQRQRTVLRVPGIKGHFGNHHFVVDETRRNGVKYSLIRDTTPLGSWAIFAEGTNFAIGASIIPN